MFTQKETRLALQIQNGYKPIITHDMHQMGSGGARIFVPPFDDPYDPNVHPILAQGINSVGQAMAAALVSEGKAGVEWLARYDLWAPARQYMVYHGQPRILTEIASVNLADPLINQNGAPMGPQDMRWNFPLPYRKSDWRLRNIVDYGNTVAFAGMAHVAKYRTTWLENFYKVHADWVNRTEPPYAFVVPAAQRDPFETFEMLDILRTGEVEVHQAKAPFKAGGKDYAAGSWVIRTAQPYGAFAKTMLERQKYPDLRLYPGGPPKPPYDVTGHTLWMLMGVAVDQIDQKFDATLELVKTPRPAAVTFPSETQGVYFMDPASNAPFMAVAKLQAVNVPVFRAAAGTPIAAGTWIVPITAESKRIVSQVSRETGFVVQAGSGALPGDVYRLKPATRIGLWRGANSMPAGWLKWVFEQYRLQPQGDRLDGFRVRPLVAVQHHRASRRHQPGDHRQRAEPRTERQGVDLGVRRRRGGLEETGRLGAGRGHARRDRVRRRDRARAARPADRSGAAAAAPPAVGRRPRRCVLLPRIAAAERVQHEPSGRVRHARLVAGLLRRRPGLSAEAGIHNPE